MNNEITTTAPAEEETHRTLFAILLDFWIEGFNFIKYIFYDLLLGR